MSHKGDERPCQRCIKRGLGDQCQDGVRKKAKYLHDAPPEALRPVLGPNYVPPRSGGQNGPAGSPTSNTSSAVGGFFPPSNTSPTFAMQYPSLGHAQMPPPLTQELSYTSQSPISPTFQAPTVQRPVSMQSLAGSVSANDLQNQAAYSGPLFDPSNPALFNFDLEGLNFGNHYGALEFGMLNHMSSGAAETPPNDHNGSISQQSDNAYNTGGIYNNNMQQYGQIYPQQDAMISDFAGIENSSGNLFELQRHHGLPRAYAIETSSQSFASPSTDAQQSPQPSAGFDSSPTTSYNPPPSTNTSAHHQTAHHRHSKRHDSKGVPHLGKKSHLNQSKYSRDPSSIYTSVTEAYPYTAGFHALTAFVQKRFPPGATLKIAKSLASIRPSFISCTKTLNREDLIFMEKCFQRTLFEYEEHYLPYAGTPTIVCRRTGELAACNKEFTLMTGWTRNVLLGKEANLNINIGKSNSASQNASQGNSGKAGLTTPRLRTSEVPKREDGRPQPVFMCELMDDESVLDFYEDFSKLAFSDSRGSVQKLCKVLKYQVKEGLDIDGKNDENGGDRKRKDVGGSSAGMLLGGRVSRIDGENGIQRLERDGKMDCAYCWTVRIDMFGMPMMIIMNVSMIVTTRVLFSTLVGCDSNGFQFLPVIV